VNDVTRTEETLFRLYSAQTGDSFGQVSATSEADALERFAKARGFESCRAMWDAGRFEYVSVAV
jgi:hypothetical protein